jgi:antitoxin PrlF
MATHSKVTAQGQISVPAVVRQKLGIGPGSVLEWEVREGVCLVRRAGRVSSAQIHAALFADLPRPKLAPIDIRQALRTAARKRHARR